MRSREGLALEEGKTALKVPLERQILLYKVFWDEEDAEAAARGIRSGASWAGETDASGDDTGQVADIELLRYTFVFAGRNPTSGINEHVKRYLTHSKRRSCNER